jgi:hypothetical protein
MVKNAPSFLVTKIYKMKFWGFLKIYTVEPRFTNASHHEQIGSRTNFPNKIRLG